MVETGVSGGELKAVPGVCPAGLRGMGVPVVLGGELLGAMLVGGFIVAGDDAGGLAAVIQGASSVVHLAGILIESRDATYEQANVAATAAVVAACQRAGVPHLVLVSAIGADVHSPNRYRRSKAAGEGLRER